MKSNTLKIQMHKNHHFLLKLKRNMRTALSLLIFPALVYFVGFVMLTYPLITHFPQNFMASSEDAYQNTWSLWWFQQAIDNDEIDLWHASKLFYPQGVSLYGHALSPLNGAIAYSLQKVLPWNQTYNILIILTFVLSGLSLFHLAYYLSKSWLSSLIAGGLFTFSTYHFQHTSGHLEMASMQWPAFFLLCFNWLLDSPTWRKAALAALLFSFTLFNTPYHFLYSVISGIILVFSYLLHNKNHSNRIRKILSSLVVFTGFSMLILGSTILDYLKNNSTESFIKVHKATEYSAELLNYFVPPSNRFMGDLTRNYWSQVFESSETKVTLSLALLVFAVIGYIRYSSKDFRLKNWLILGLFFLILSLGPILIFQGYPPTISGSWVYISLPYAWLTKMIPILDLSGVPGRMAIMPLMAGCVIASMGVKYLQQNMKLLLVTILVVIAIIDSTPQQTTTLDASIPIQATKLSKLPKGGLLDRANKPALAMYYQIYHQQPIVDGYTSRVSQANQLHLENLNQALKLNNLPLLCNTYQVKYYWTDFQIENLEPIIADRDTFIYDLQPGGNCLQVN